MPGINHNDNWKLHARLEYLIGLKTYCIKTGLQKPDKLQFHSIVSNVFFERFDRKRKFKTIARNKH